MKIVLDENAKVPTKAHESDAGFDLYSRETKTIKAKGSEVFDTGVHIELPISTVGMLKSKSGLNMKYGITSEGVIDVGYSGSIIVKLYNHSDKDYVVSVGDKITQLVILPILPFVNRDLEIVKELSKTERGVNGFGSSGK